MFDPGTQWDYGISIDWIGRLVVEAERPAARRLHAGEHLRPLGMDEYRLQ